MPQLTKCKSDGDIINYESDDSAIPIATKKVKIKKKNTKDKIIKLKIDDMDVVLMDNVIDKQKPIIDNKKINVQQKKEISKELQQKISNQNSIINHLQENIKKHGKFFKIPTTIDFKKVDTHSWFNIYEAKHNNFEKLPKNSEIISDELYDEEDDKDAKFSTIQLKLLLTNGQEKVIDRWIECYTVMYNETIRYLRGLRFNKLKLESRITLKKSMHAKKQEIIEKSTLIVTIDDKQMTVKIPSHELDYAINDALNRLKSCLTNFKRKNIKHFRLRYIKLSKKDKTMKIEKMSFTEKSFCVSGLGKQVDCNIHGFNYKQNVETTQTIKKRGSEYFLLWKRSKDFSDYMVPKKDSIVGIDLGVRTMVTGYSNNKVIEIGENVGDKFEKKFKAIKMIYKAGFSERKTKRLAWNKYNKMNNMAKDMRWKTGKYLTDNFETIVVGNFSTKEMGEKDTVNKKTKRVGNMMSLYKLKNIIKYYVKQKGLHYKEVDEAGTTQCCGKCGNRKRDIGAAKIYKCDKCKTEIGRDINSSRLMIITSIE